MTPLDGILPVLPTPFSPSGGVDSAAMENLVEFAIESGADGLVFPGFASEVSELTPDERNTLLETVVKTANQRLPIVAGATANSAREVIRHGQAAKSLGLSYLMIQPPREIGNSLDSVMTFFSEIAAELSDMQFILQNAPAPRGSDLAPETINALAKNIPQIVYVKEETLPAGPAISYLVENKPDTLLGIIGGGGARYILDEYARGACAAMPALEIVDLHVALDRAWREGNHPEARQLYIRTLPLLTLQAVYRMYLTKHVLVRRGILQNTIVRAPTPELDAVATADIDRNLAELGFIDAESNPVSAA